MTQKLKRKSPPIIMKTNRYNYQRYVFTIICLSIGFLLIYISYTNGVHRTWLPRLRTQVRTTVCSLMTVPCAAAADDAEQEEKTFNTDVSSRNDNFSSRGEMGKELSRTHPQELKNYEEVDGMKEGNILLQEYISKSTKDSNEREHADENNGNKDIYAGFKSRESVLDKNDNMNNLQKNTGIMTKEKKVVQGKKRLRDRNQIKDRGPQIQGKNAEGGKSLFLKTNPEENKPKESQEDLSNKKDKVSSSSILKAEPPPGKTMANILVRANSGREYFPYLDFKLPVSPSGARDVSRSRSKSDERDYEIPENLTLSEKWQGRPMEPLLADTSEVSIQKDYDLLQFYLINGGVNLTLMSREKWGEKPLDYEMALLRDPPLEDIYRAANHLTSKVTLLNPQPAYQVNDVIKLQIDVFEGQNNRLARGGDHIRVWAVEHKKNASVAGTVMDLQNGSYIAEIKLKWTGIQTIKAELTYPRETLRAHYYLRHVTKCIRYVAAGFTKSHLSESTLCSPFHVVPGYTKLCNFSDTTYGTTWFCGHPRKLGLQCADWVSMRDLEFMQPFPLTVAEEQLLISLRQPPEFRLIPGNIEIKVSKGITKLPLKLCSSVNHKATWQLSRPRGFMFYNKWIRTDCRPQKFSKAEERECLKDTTFILAGDSNLLMFFHSLVGLTNCSVIEDPLSQTWHHPRSCVRPDSHFHMSWALHGYPVHPVSDHWVLRSELQEVTDAIKAIPATGKYIVLIHLFIHFTIHHHEVFINRMQATKLAVEELLERNPNVMVIVRGPHSATTGWSPQLGGDMMAPLMRELTVRIFEDLHERVLYLDFWDMTIATENSNFHPEPKVNKAMIGVMLDHICARGRKTLGALKD